MFIKTDSDRLQNLYVLQDVRVVEDEGKFYVGWVQTNGVIVKDGEYNDYNSAKAKVDSIIEDLLE